MNEQIVRGSSRSQKRNGLSRTEKMEAHRHRTELCAASKKYLCIRCGKNSNKMKMSGKCEGPKSTKLKTRRGGDTKEQNYMDGHRMMTRVGSKESPQCGAGAALGMQEFGWAQSQ